MSSIARNRLGQLSSLKLPVIPPEAPGLIKSLSTDDLSLRELATLIEKFPVIVGKLISLANSAWSAPVTDIISTEAACSRLGSDVVKSVSIAILVSSSFSLEKCPRFDPGKYWCSAILTAELAARLAAISCALTAPEPSTVRTAGLLHNLGLLWLADQLPAEVNRALLQTDKFRNETLQQRLKDVLEFDQAQAGGLLATLWELPDPLVYSIKHYLDTSYEGRYFELVLTTGLSARLVSTILKNEEPDADEYIRLAGTGISQEDVAPVIAQIVELVPRTQATAKIFAEP